MPHPLVTPQMIDAFQKDGVVLVKDLFADHVQSLRDGVALNMEQPGPYASENRKQGETGRFFDDYCNWSRIPQFREVIQSSPLAEVAADLMQSETVQMFHDHVLVKEPGTSMATPWHQDGPYYFAEGRQTISFWSPLDPVREATLRCVAGSHLWEKEVLPTRWVSEEGFFPDKASTSRCPTPRPKACGSSNSRWSRATRSPFISAPCTARGATAQTGVGGHFRCVWWAMTRAMSSARGGPRHLFRAMTCNRVSACARTGFRSC